MARNPNFSKNEILEIAYEILIKDGNKGLTARNIASKLGVSTIAIYSSFKSMGNLKNELSRLAKNKLFDRTKLKYTDIDLLNIGIGICIFAKQEKSLFRAIFFRENLSKEFVDEIVYGLKDILTESFKADDKHKYSDEAIEWMLKKGWWYVHGYATLICSGFYNPTFDEIKKELLDMGSIIISMGKRI